MTWQTKVASWVIPLLVEYAVPDDAEVLSDVELGTLGSATGSVTMNSLTNSASFPGLVPNYSVQPVIVPRTTDVLYTLKALKAVGFYGVSTEVLAYDQKRINNWTFPIDRKNFGFCAIGRGDLIVHSQSIIYGKQIITSDACISLITSYDDEFDSRNVFNSADKFCCTAVHTYLSPSVQMRVSFLPVYEVWAVRFSRTAADPCQVPTSLAPPAPPYPDINPLPPWRAGATLLCLDNAYYVLRCTSAEGYSWVFNGFEG